MMDPTMMPPPVQAPTAAQPGAMPTATLDPAFEAKRKQIAMALMAQRGMQKPTAMGNFANSGLQMWNMMRKPPTSPMSSMTPPADPMANQPMHSAGE